MRALLICFWSHALFCCCLLCAQAIASQRDAWMERAQQAEQRIIDLEDEVQVCSMPGRTCLRRLFSFVFQDFPSIGCVCLSIPLHSHSASTARTTPSACWKMNAQNFESSFICSSGPMVRRCRPKLLLRVRLATTQHPTACWRACSRNKRNCGTSRVCSKPNCRWVFIQETVRRKTPAR